ncbi:hypothetical protein A2634_03590 [Candidatus Amesbacteria bacterium RIFCSPHIGHO2_01_FULL_48_32]|uniref:Type II secretion system protein GspG C-terminal domain-containing protein n=1 Tax=Candidatus Amesbacteria bacterium RIFCSPLOWO2_01_FULL_48_25 TaxID=1797259 RepID=A0A1F4ZC11_9BACT|nr:MAG: hypothetical protein A2634_03590 [Candidatus Amesbacteria bacterium RIFCSPHIGHO2_01_FULL_48_32]OGD03761.1 MAG: hypothetical protein A2989_03710 [Candidatus Amesbacteria bacterium RIFCSPLOWO2_01_FULL_48_25]HJZ05132.1 hypothetical protein [Patescibacteria group bacterium]
MEFDILDWKRREIVFVGVVLTIVLGVSVFQLKIGEMKTRDAQRKADVELVARAMERYYADYGQYPIGSEGKIVSCGDRGLATCEWGEGSMVDGDNVVYLKKLPVDPLAFRGWEYTYETGGEGQKFRIYVGLEYGRDPGAKTGLTKECGVGIQCKWYVSD